jgi:hypothetical protein
MLRLTHLPLCQPRPIFLTNFSFGKDLFLPFRQISARGTPIDKCGKWPTNGQTTDNRTFQPTSTASK